MKLLGAAFLVVLLVSGCATAQPTLKVEALYPNKGPDPVEVATLLGRTLVATSVTMGEWPIETELGDPTRLRVEFDSAGGVRMTGGCDTITGKGPLTVVDRIYLNVGRLESTNLAGCETDTPRQDRWLRDLFESQPLVMVNGSSVRFSGAGGWVWMTDGTWE